MLSGIDEARRCESALRALTGLVSENQRLGEVNPSDLGVLLEMIGDHLNFSLNTIEKIDGPPDTDNVIRNML